MKLLDSKGTNEKVKRQRVVREQQKGNQLRNFSWHRNKR